MIFHMMFERKPPAAFFAFELRIDAALELQVLVQRVLVFIFSIALGTEMKDDRLSASLGSPISPPSCKRRNDYF